MFTLIYGQYEVKFTIDGLYKIEPNPLIDKWLKEINKEYIKSSLALFPDEFFNFLFWLEDYQG